MSTTTTNTKPLNKKRNNSIDYRCVNARFTPEEFKLIEEYSERENRSFASTVQYFTLQKLREVRQSA